MQKAQFLQSRWAFNWCREKTFMIIKQGSMTQLDNPRLNSCKAGGLLIGAERKPL